MKKIYKFLSIFSLILLLNSCGGNSVNCLTSNNNSNNSISSPSTTDNSSKDSDSSTSEVCDYNEDDYWDAYDDTNVCFFDVYVKDGTTFKTNEDLKFQVILTFGRKLDNYDSYCSFQYNISSTPNDVKQQKPFYIQQITEDFYKKHFMSYITRRTKCLWNIEKYLIDVTIPIDEFLENSKNGQYITFFYCDDVAPDGYYYTDGVKDEYASSARLRKVYLLTFKDDEIIFNV